MSSGDLVALRVLVCLLLAAITGMVFSISENVRTIRRDVHKSVCVVGYYDNHGTEAAVPCKP